MKQSGINKIILFENRSLSIDYDNFSISTGGEVVEIFNFPKLTIEPGVINVKYEINFQVDDLTPDDVEKINNSIYGWIAKIYFLDRSVKLIEKPFFNLTASEINTNSSHSRNITLQSWNRLGLIPFN